MNEIRVMISSTARDLPDHRKEVEDACQRLGMFHPEMMEHLAAEDANAVEVSIALVDKADVYIGILGHRYGCVPQANNPDGISITEMEYNRACQRDIPRLIFIMHDEHLVRAGDFDTGTGAAKLHLFKERLTNQRVSGFFKSPLDLKNLVFQSLIAYRPVASTSVHFVAKPPALPKPYVAHPYTLLQTRRLVGRNKELGLLTDWIKKPQSSFFDCSVLNIVAIGGMGKSALAWHWFNTIAPQEIRPLAGRIWWSFYESDSSFDNFVSRALAYVAQISVEEVERRWSPSDREDQLLSLLNLQPFLIVLDGLERILVAYSNPNACRLPDEGLDRQTKNSVSNAIFIGPGARKHLCVRHRLRKCVDSRTGEFFKRLVAVQNSKILITTRLYPAELQKVTGETIAGCGGVFLTGLDDDSSVDLWRELGAKASRDELLRLFGRIKNYPLLITALAGEVAHFRPAPGDFDEWLKSNPTFDPFVLPLTQVKTHILEFALNSLDPVSLAVLETVAAFRMAVNYDTLRALLTTNSVSEQTIDDALTDLEDRGLLGWDRRSNRYDLHPVVRGVVWGRISNALREDILSKLCDHFEAFPSIATPASVDELTPAIEKFHALIGLQRYDDAYELYSARLSHLGFRHLCAYQHLAELLECLFPNGVQKDPFLSSDHAKSETLLQLGASYVRLGLLNKGLNLLKRHNKLCEALGCVGHQAMVAESCGKFFEAEIMLRSLVPKLRDAREFNIESRILCFIAESALRRGALDEIPAILRRLRIAYRQLPEWERSVERAHVDALRFALAIENGQLTKAKAILKRMQREAQLSADQDRIISADMDECQLLSESGDIENAIQKTRDTLKKIRQTGSIAWEITALNRLARLCCAQHKWDEAKNLLDDIWDLVERGPYPAAHAFALNTLSEVEFEIGNQPASISAAKKAFELAWCDGPPFASATNLKRAREQLRLLQSPEPEHLPLKWKLASMTLLPI